VYFKSGQKYDDVYKTLPFDVPIKNEAKSMKNIQSKISDALLAMHKMKKLSFSTTLILSSLPPIVDDTLTLLLNIYKIDLNPYLPVPVDNDIDDKNSSLCWLSSRATRNIFSLCDYLIKYFWQCHKRDDLKAVNILHWFIDFVIFWLFQVRPNLVDLIAYLESIILKMKVYLKRLDRAKMNYATVANDIAS
jgi:hypothetical protein